MSLVIIASTLMTLTLAAPPEPTPTAQPLPTVPSAPTAPSAPTERPGEIGERPTERADDAARYAELEQKTPAKVGEFRGGSAVIFVSTGAAIVLIVLLILLI